MPSRFYNRQRFGLDSVGILSFKSGLPSKKASIFKHIITLRVQRPVVPLEWLIGLNARLDETVVQREVIANADFPRWVGITIKGKPVSDKLAYPIKSQPFF